MRLHRQFWQWLFSVVGLVVTGVVLSCGGGTTSPQSGRPRPNQPLQNICACVPEQPASADYRHKAKHVGLSGPTGQEITVGALLSWDRPPEPAADAPRSGRENQMFHIARAFLQLAWINPGDCDLHLEIAETPDKGAPRVIVETPIEAEYCSARRTIQSQLAARQFVINYNSGELAAPFEVEVLGLAFQDFNHRRGSGAVATTWELHPAIVSIK